MAVRNYFLVVPLLMAWLKENKGPTEQNFTYSSKLLKYSKCLINAFWIQISTVLMSGEILFGRTLVFFKPGH